PGIRIGWVTCRDRHLMRTLLAAQEQAALALSMLDQAVATHIFARREAFLPGIRAHMAIQRAIVRDWVAEDPAVEWVEPEGGVVCFPRFTDPDVNARRIYGALQGDGVFLGPGWWFEQEERSMRIGYGYPTAEELRGGLAAISAAVRGS
ncbi:MAG: aminotransferase class I/II-fold pyridoxal phosphate-dependent enzyme, partial [Chloroflexota bacterium]|nr:aminotransferase class I/II-fold pyridoxal phosphate-dependent enzyme [Chloroflexota bacterium]